MKLTTMKLCYLSIENSVKERTPILNLYPKKTIVPESLLWNFSDVLLGQTDSQLSQTHVHIIILHLLQEFPNFRFKTFQL